MAGKHPKGFPSDPWTASECVAERVAYLRNKQGMSAQQLADALEDMDKHTNLNRSVIANIESGRRDSVSIDEVLLLARALNVAPIDLFLPVGEEYRWFAVGDTSADGEGPIREWVRGEWALGGQDAAVYATEGPDWKWDPPTSVEDLAADLEVIARRLRSVKRLKRKGGN